MTKQMTKAEAIEILRDTPIDIRSTREDDIHTLYATAQGMAIEALEAQERQELIVGSYLIEEPSCSEKQINMAIGAITHMLSIGYYSEDMEDALNLAIKVLAETELSCSEKPNRSDLVKESGDLVKDLVNDCISRQDAIDAIVAWTVEDRPDVEMPTDLIDRITGLPSAQPEPDHDLIHLQKEQAYMQGWKDGQEALREEIWENERDRLD